MKKSQENPLNPEQEIQPVQEETTIAVNDTEVSSESESMESEPETGLIEPSVSDLSEPELAEAPETNAIEEMVAETPEEAIESMAEEPMTETVVETVPEMTAEPVADVVVEESETEMTVEPVEVIAEEPVAEMAEETEHDGVEEPVAEVSEEVVSEVTEVHEVESIAPEEEMEPGSIIIAGESIDLQADEHLDDHLEGITAENVEQVVIDPDISFDHCSRTELVEMLEKAVAEPDINMVKTRIALIKVAYLKKKKEENLQKYEEVSEEGGTKEELAPVPDELDEKFNEIFTIYRANKARHTEEQEKIKQNNLRKKQQILDALRELINSEETLKKTYDEFKALQENWKEVGMVPRTEINNLWQNYHFLVEKFFEKVKLNKELKDLDLRKNLEAKIALCEKTEELLLETSVIRSFKKLQKYHEEWKELGPVPNDKKDEIWERFKIATDKINERRREHYALIEQDQNKNLETKLALCEQVELIAGLQNDSIRQWQDNTTKVNDLLKIWKNIGPVPQKVNAEIWTRFKTSLDAFFAVKKEYFDKLKEQQMHNYNLKVELCMQAESLSASTDWKNTTNELIRLQGEWKKIGPVPKKHSDRIWKRFRSACDGFFNAKQAYFSNIQSFENENLTKKLDLMNRLKEYAFSEDKAANLEVLKNFQREWTDIGHVPMKEKDKLHNEFRTLVNQHLDKLKISEVEMSAVNFQTRVDNMRNDPNARKVISKEREFLANRITKMKEEITLWENNIGFFAKSKSASVVKEEFENKISKAKSELKVLEAKMKILRQQGG